MIKIFIFSCIVLTFTVLICIYRGIIGPSAQDRLIAINVIGTKTIILILIVSFILNEKCFIDVALIYALISFITSIIICNYIKKWGKG